MFEGLRKFFLSKILRRKYYRTGKCKACGKCCTQIYVKHYKHVVSDEKEFENLLKVMTEAGVLEYDAKYKELVDRSFADKVVK